MTSNDSKENYGIKNTLLFYKIHWFNTKFLIIKYKTLN